MINEENNKKKESPKENWEKILEFREDIINNNSSDIPISSAVRLKFQPYDWWKDDFGYLDDYGNLK
jgi:hypothetical protein